MYGMTPVGVFFIAFFPLVIMIRHFVNSPKLSQSWRPRLSISASLRLDLPPTKI